MNKFETGDVVVLRGGGPRLTISGIDRYNGVVCASVDWFTEAGELKSHFFPLEALKKANDTSD